MSKLFTNLVTNLAFAKVAKEYYSLIPFSTLELFNNIHLLLLKVHCTIDVHRLSKFVFEEFAKQQKKNVHVSAICRKLQENIASL